MTEPTSQSASRPDPQSEFHVLLDLKLALSRLDGDTALLNDLINLFLEECACGLREFRTAVEVRELARLKSATSALRSSAAHFGGMRVNGLAVQIEALCNEGNLDGALSLTDSFEAEFKRLVKMLQDEDLKRKGVHEVGD
jgi:HPt (histidine-containing phosphotransfer) domain-containing protein